MKTKNWEFYSTLPRSALIWPPFEAL